MFSITVKGKLAELGRALGVDAPKKLKRETAIATNYTAKEVQKGLAKEIGKELATTQKEIRKTIEITAKATANRLSATVTQRQTKRLPLRVFGARQTKKGVSVRISKREGRKVIPGAFIVKSYGGNVYRRPGTGRATGGSRKGPSPWGVTVVLRIDKKVAKDITPIFIKQIDRRIRAVNFKKSQG
jgi:hypothetical protein